MEGTAAELAVNHTDRRHLLDLEKIVEDIDKAIAGKEIQTYVQLNQKFHFALYERAGTPLLLGMIKDFWCNVGPFFTRLFDDEDYLPLANEFHRKILQALRDGDAARVRQYVMADISEAARSLMPGCRTRSNTPLRPRSSDDQPARATITAKERRISCRSSPSTINTSEERDPSPIAAGRCSGR